MLPYLSIMTRSVPGRAAPALKRLDAPDLWVVARAELSHIP